MSKPSKDDGKKAKPTYRIPADGPWAGAWRISAVIGIVGLAAASLGWSSDPRRFAFSWLFAFMTFLAVGLGGLFFVLGQHLTGAGWGVTVRRTAEFMMSGLPVFALLFVPIALNLDHLYPWMHMEEGHGEEIREESGGHGMLENLAGSVAHAQDPQELHDISPDEWVDEREEEEHHHSPLHAEHEHIVRHKLPFFHSIGHAGFFSVRVAIYFIAWILLTYFFFTWSTRQDKEKGLELTKKMQRLAPAATFVFALTLTFAAFDWMMSMEPSWYSTIYGVQYFAVSAVIGHAVIILLSLSMRRSGLIGEAVNVEHYHDLGKLLFGFIVFWAYISFSQFMLIWYAGIPEEATYYHLRWWGGGGFKGLSIIVVLGHFVLPFFLLISRNAKRRLEFLAFGCVWMLVMHVVEMYWLVMPYAEQEPDSLVHTALRIHWIDIACLFAVGGIYMSVVLFQMTRFPLVPVGDPRLARALKFENA